MRMAFDFLHLRGIGKFDTLPRYTPADVVPTGSTIADAAALYEKLCVVTGADATKGVQLPVPSGKGARVILKNATAAILKVYPQSGATINALSASAAISIAASVPVTFISLDGTNWVSFPLVAS